MLRRARGSATVCDEYPFCGSGIVLTSQSMSRTEYFSYQQILECLTGTLNNLIGRLLYDLIRFFIIWQWLIFGTTLYTAKTSFNTLCLYQNDINQLP